jgi:hypothetical protein
MLDFTELQEDLELTLLGEVWEKNQIKADRKSVKLPHNGPNTPMHYHTDRALRHQAQADFHKAASSTHLWKSPEARVHNLADPDKSTHHVKKAAKHQALADAHRNLSDKYKRREIDLYAKPKEDSED